MNEASATANRRAVVIGAVAAGLVGFAVSWIGSAPHSLNGIHWDTGSYLARFATTTNRWRNAGVWTSHLMLPQLYITACALAELVGASCYAGFRVLQSLCVGGAAAIVYLTALGLARSRAVAALVTLCTLTAWGTLTLVFGMVDNLVFWPAELGLLFVCLRRIDGWRDRDSAVAGVLAAVASLISLQCLPWLLAPLFVATLLGGARPWHVRARHVGVLVGSFAATAFVWALVLATTTTSSLYGVLDAMTSRPQASYVPKDAGGWNKVLQANLFWRHLGAGIAQQLVSVYESDWLFSLWPSAGMFLVGAEIAAFGACVYLQRKRRIGAPLVLLTFLLLAFTNVASLYHDHIAEKWKRYSFLTLLTFLLAAALVGAVERERARRIVVRVAIALGAFVVLLQTVHGIDENVAWHENQPYLPHGLADYVGRNHWSWMAYFQELARANPGACRYVFDVRELESARWNHEVTAGMITELGRYAMIGVPAEVAKWKEKPPLIPPGAYGAVQSCDWLSPSARSRLQSP